MKFLPAALAVLTLLCACQAGAAVSYIEDFNGTYVAGPTGPIPDTWTYFGFGPPSYTQQETGIVLPPNTGSNSSLRINIPGNSGSGVIILYKGAGLDSYALPGQPIDWNFPVTLAADVYGSDLGFNTRLDTFVDLTGYSGTITRQEWGNETGKNAEWVTITKVLDPGQAGKNGTLMFGLDFDYTSLSFPEVNAAIFENIRIDYTPVPEPSSILALAGGLLGLISFKARKAF